MPQQIPTKIAGIFQYPEGKQALKKALLDDQVFLEWEPNNPHDPNAISVHMNDGAAKVKVGYIPKVLAAQLKGKIIQDVKKGSAWDMITVTIE